jgi:hypothetical protein
LFEKLLSFAGPLLLYAEEIDAASGHHLGNFPQAFTHLALIAALRLANSAPHTRKGPRSTCLVDARCTTTQELRRPNVMFTGINRGIWARPRKVSGRPGRSSYVVWKTRRQDVCGVWLMEVCYL